MKEKELREFAECSVCNKKVMSGGMPIFWTVEIERHGINAGAVKQQAGLEMMVGSVALAQVMGPDKEMTLPLMDPVKLSLCEACAMESPIIREAMSRAEEA